MIQYFLQNIEQKTSLFLIDHLKKTVKKRIYIQRGIALNQIIKQFQILLHLFSLLNFFQTPRHKSLIRHMHQNHKKVLIPLFFLRVLTEHFLSDPPELIFLQNLIHPFLNPFTGIFYLLQFTSHIVPIPPLFFRLNDLLASVRDSAQQIINPGIRAIFLHTMQKRFVSTDIGASQGFRLDFRIVQRTQIISDMFAVKVCPDNPRLLLTCFLVKTIEIGKSEIAFLVRIVLGI